ncbi:N-acetyltransferase family protein [Streptomyces sp. NBC_01298]|uniref:GNAT family N-acetyltransferase n=1 Tax=Streptomyces sp. NBC_01298 TaxID=2903817 RepID=UPI002E10EF98|nr:N-acetyltransferase family protein [Streptomyces sp. NBC_01298]
MANSAEYEEGVPADDRDGAVLIRAAEPDDLAALTDLYNHYVLETPVTFDVDPLTPGTRLEWLEAHPAAGRHRLLVAQSAGRVIGYASSSPYRPKKAFETSVETSVYLAPDQGRRGIGSRLYSELFRALADEDVHRAYAAVTPPNPGSVRLHDRFGFEPVGVHREVGRKFGTYWDVGWYQKEMR